MAITWIIGNSDAGKTTLAHAILEYDTTYNNNMHDDVLHPYYKPILLDGNYMRDIWDDLGLSKKDRITQNIRVAKLAKMLEDQGHNVVVSVICPYRELRATVKKITNCKFIYIEGGKKGKDYPFDQPELY